MAQLIADRRDVDFVLHEQLGVVKHEQFEEFNKKMVDMIVTEARNLAIKEFLPTQKDGDDGCRFENGKVSVPESFHRIYKLFTEGEWLAMSDDPELGGQGMPKMCPWLPMNISLERMFRLCFTTASPTAQPNWLNISVLTRRKSNT